MTRALSVAAFACIGLSVLLLGRRHGSPVPPLGDMLTLAVRSRTGRAITLACWVWVGWHVFGR
ncbi:MAG TPA: DUF6186 family protein [Mycobacteriales bacterium]|nr:DUF6186 family protein [Mycobacteriales bacterium]